MVRHIEANHITGVSHSCDICGRTSRSRNALRKHKYENHKNHISVKMDWGIINLGNTRFKLIFRSRDGLRVHKRNHSSAALVKHLIVWKYYIKNIYIATKSEQPNFEKSCRTSVQDTHYIFTPSRVHILHRPPSTVLTIFHNFDQRKSLVTVTNDNLWQSAQDSFVVRV